MTPGEMKAAALRRYSQKILSSATSRCYTLDRAAELVEHDDQAVVLVDGNVCLITNTDFTRMRNYSFVNTAGE